MDSAEPTWRDSALTLVGGTSHNFQDMEVPDVLAINEDVLEQHEDHQDAIDDFNVWDDDEFQYINDMVIFEVVGDYQSGWIKTSQTLLDDPNVQGWMQKFTKISKGGYFPLEIYKKERFLAIPLFADDKGREYQVTFGDYGGHGAYSKLPSIRCPLVLHDNGPQAKGFFELKCRMPVPTQLSTPLPKSLLHLGDLRVRHYPYGRAHYLEEMDYSVVVDADDTELPVWILASRKQLQSRPMAIESFPLFEGLMNEPDRLEEGYHDIACILSSVRRLGIPPGQPGAPNYQESCELVRRTRATVDPASIKQPHQRLFDFVEAESIPAAIDYRTLFTGE